MAVFSRNCAILENILGAEHILDDPQSTTEEILLAILNHTEYTKSATSRNETILLAILNNTECSITVPRSETEAVLLYVLNKAIYDKPVTSYFTQLLVLWSKQVADPERFAFPFAINEPVEMSVEE